MPATKHLWIVVAMLGVAAVCAAAQNAADVPEAEPAVPPEASEGEAAAGAAEERVEMVRFVLGRKAVEGRLVMEDETVLRVEGLDGTVVGYEKATLRDVQRYDLRASRYHEKMGDYYVGRLWDFEDDLTDFARARREYRRALSIADTAAVRQKLADLQREREEWQQELLRRKAVEQAEARVEAAVLEKEMLQQQLQSQQEVADELERHALLLEELEGRIERLEDSSRLARERLADLRRDVERLERDVLRHWRSIRVYLRDFDSE